MRNFLSEDDIEEAVLTELCAQELPWRELDCYTADAGDLNDKSNRSDKSEVVFKDILRRQLEQLNSELPERAIDIAEQELTKGRRAMTLMNANIEVYKLIREGVPVSYDNEHGKEENAFVQVIDFENPENNDFLAVQQLWIQGELGYRRPDVILYINGLPLILIELKNNSVSVEDAYTDNLNNYKNELHQLFWYNAITILSNGKETKVGSFTAGWEHFGEWLRVDDEKERPDKSEIKKSSNSLKYTVNGILTQQNVLDFIENYVMFYRNDFKVLAKNHQYLGVNNAVNSFSDRLNKEGRLGVFWHTQGSGKSFSMVFLARKIFRKFNGNFTFVIITDREDLDTQIYRNFLDMGACQKADTSRPKNSKELREVLATNKRYIFTLIQKFRIDKGKQYPLVSERDDIIVLVDEAHRTQYKDLAENMRIALPNAQYMAFTGTPLLGKNNKTNKWFGNYVSEYNFAQAIADGATVPLYYDKRLPELHVINEELDDELAEIVEEEELNEKQQEILERKYASTIGAITRDDRLETVAKDIAAHFPRRGYLGKGMVVCIDKFTTVKMHNKVSHYIKEERKTLQKELSKCNDEVLKESLKKSLSFLKEIKLAVVISKDAKDLERFKERGLDLKTHHDRLDAVDENGQNVEDNFKDPNNPLQLVFVCAMWLTGFDAPTVSTLYLDKPMQNHTLMQTIARANRVAPGKTSGLIVDYCNVTENLKLALKDYGKGDNANPDQNPEDKDPLENKDDLFELLDAAMQLAKEFCLKHGIDLQEVIDSEETFAKLDLFDEYADILLEGDELRKEFNVYENTCKSLYDNCRPDILKQREKYKIVEVLSYLRKVIDNYVGLANYDRADRRLGELMDDSVLTSEDGKEILNEQPKDKFRLKYNEAIEVTEMDKGELKKNFKKRKHKNIEVASLKAFIERKLEIMLSENITRTSFLERYKEMVERYNSGGKITEDYYSELIDFVENLESEDKRSIELGLSSAELELFDLIRKEKLTKKQEQDVKNAAKMLLTRLMDEKPKVLVQDWFRDSETKQKVKSEISKTLDTYLPQEPYGKDDFDSVCTKIYDHVFIQASHGKSYAAA